MSGRRIQIAIAIFAFFSAIFALANYRYPALGCAIAVVILGIVRSA